MMFRVEKDIFINGVVDYAMIFYGERRNRWVFTFTERNFKTKNESGYLKLHPNWFNENESKIIRKFCLFGEE